MTTNKIMYRINSKEVKDISKRKGLYWKEGLTKQTILRFIKKFGNPPKDNGEETVFWWSKAESYVFHRTGSQYYWCVTKETYERYAKTAR